VRRLPTGGRVDRAAPLRFRFGGREYQGLEGDTLAAALLANGLRGAFRSPVLGRPRGVMTAGPEEPCAFVEVSAPWLDLIAPATMVPLVDGLAAGAAGGIARLPGAEPGAGAGSGAGAGAGPPASEHRHAHVETLVVGGGVAGLSAAREAAGRGDRVLLVDERAWLGGVARSSERVEGRPAWGWVDAVARGLRAGADATLLVNAAALGVYDAGYVVVHERSRPVERLWHVRARRVVLATGAHERPVAFAGNDRPGVMLSGAVLTYLDRFGVLPTERAVVLTTNDAGYLAADALREAGATVVAVVDVRPGAEAQDRARAAGLRVLPGSVVVATEGGEHVTAAIVEGPGAGRSRLEADLVAVSGGWNPVMQLHRAAGGGLRYAADRCCFVPDGGPRWLSVVGAAAGEVPATEPCWYVPAGDLSEHFVDLQRDQTVADVADALGTGLRSVEHVKRHTYIGTAVDQGRSSGALAAEVVNQLLGADPGAQGPTSARPPWSPVAYHVLAGPYRGELFDAVRRTPMHAVHVERGAVFEHVGQWLRPWYFPRDGESMQAAVLRECAAVRSGVGMIDASTLGKIEVVGADAPPFLDRMYSNSMSRLEVGKIRYGLMLGLDGMVFDDGVAMRLAPDRYLVTTTTGGAARVLARFEEWLQTEWPDLRVHCTSVTEQWATVAVAGPRSRDLLRAAGTDVDVSREAFPFMTWRDGQIAGVPARLARVSFSGELAVEVHVAGWHGRHVWEALLTAGQPLGLTPYGTGTMDVLRAEKGFIIVGQDTDGTVTADDLGMSWAVNLRKGDFVGRRSLRRADLVRPDRLHLVGLLPVERDALIPEGAQLVAAEHAEASPPVPMLGHVTSSYRSAVLGGTFALGLLSGGRERLGSVVYARTGGGAGVRADGASAAGGDKASVGESDRPGAGWGLGVARADTAIAATVTSPVLYDSVGARRDG
jgi:sarcosine oxidase subunit alpha